MVVWFRHDRSGVERHVVAHIEGAGYVRGGANDQRGIPPDIAALYAFDGMGRRLLEEVAI